MDLVTEIKAKKELAGVDDSLVLEILAKKLKKREEELSEKERKLVVKAVRAELRNYVGRFQKSGREKVKLVENEDYEKLIRAHSSTVERAEIYPQVMELINSFSPKSILDLGCGINPIFIIKNLNYKGVNYYAYDVNQSDLDAVNAFFEREGINGEVFCKDIRKVEKFPSADLCMIFKVFDIIERDNYRASENILAKLDCKRLIVSFSTKTLSGRFMERPRRMWFENLLSKGLGKKFEMIKTKNEIFYVVDFKS